MFSGKTEELIRRVRRALYARQKVEIYKPQLDTRFDEIEIVSHTKQSLSAKPIESVKEIMDVLDPKTQVVGIDEAQFFDRDLVDVCQNLADRGLRVIVTGLDQDYRGLPFEPMPELLAVAEFVTKSMAICMVCGNPAGRSQRLIRDKEQVVLGAGEAYEARCRRCHNLEDAAPEQPRLFR
ncbi:thymidine kinase [Myxococcota bacterium]